MQTYINKTDSTEIRAFDDDVKVSDWLDLSKYRPMTDDEIAEHAKQSEPDQSEVIKKQLTAIDKESATDRTWREYVIAHADDFDATAVARLQDYENQAIALRKQLASLS